MNVGWLDVGEPYHQGPVDPALVHALLRLSMSHSVRQMRGYHGCPFCGVHTHLPTSFEEGFNGTVHLGSAEIQVTSRDGTVYAAPTTVAHYVAEHGYQPPQAFVDAVLTASAKVGPWGTRVPTPQPDLSEGFEDDDPVRWVGWLNPEHDFTGGPVDHDLLAALRQLDATHKNWTSSPRACPVCHEWYTSDTDDRRSGQLIIPSADEIPYAVPTMIVHLVEAHGYQPPAEFVAAVFAALE
ncbi:hypothetical protein [Actinokineospora globicatena]|uniref:DUF7919 family protein n=1 Tax=Actinokineospora globicatena TaxID=103729 RepID=UPI0020A3CA6C|nr:hypothetical protein [Actinokineospora globicatena]